MKKTLTLIAISVFLGSLNLKAQVGTWVSLSAEKKLVKKVSLEGNVQLRELDFTNKIDKYVAELGVNFNLPKGFETSIFYRYNSSYKKKSDLYEPTHRFYGNINYSKKLSKKLELGYRFRYQNQFKDDTNGELASDKSYLRNKIELEFPNKSNFKPSIGADFFYQIGYTFDQVRIKAGTTYKINKRQRISADIFTDQAIKTGKANTLIFQLDYKYKF